jgi:hypothetical protein
MGLVAPLPFCRVLSAFGAGGRSTAGFLWQTLPPVSASSSVKFALVLLVLLFVFVFQLDESAQNILVDL